MDTKRCCTCGKTKAVGEFSKDRSRKDGLQNKCKACVRQYYAANREARLESMRQYRDANREARRERQRKYYAANREAVVERSVQYHRRRRKTDPGFRMAQNLRTRQNQFFRGIRRSLSMVRDIGCSWEFFVQHIESQLTEPMTIDNYGKVWQIDHIYPLTKADIATNRVHFLAVANWRNLRPMLSEENNVKDDTVTPEAQRLFDELCWGFASLEVA